MLSFPSFELQPMGEVSVLAVFYRPPPGVPRPLASALCHSGRKHRLGTRAVISASWRHSWSLGRGRELRHQPKRDSKFIQLEMRPQKGHRLV